MKTLKKLLLTGIAAMFVLTASTLNAQENSNLSEVKIKTSAVCDMCKETLESNLVFEKGIKKSELDVKSAIINVTYNPQKTNPDKIRAAISKLGYDADDIPADKKAYEKLSSCCKKENKAH